jgi:hypothetical protein
MEALADLAQGQEAPAVAEEVGGDAQLAVAASSQGPEPMLEQLPVPQSCMAGPSGALVAAATSDVGASVLQLASSAARPLTSEVGKHLAQFCAEFWRTTQGSWASMTYGNLAELWGKSRQWVQASERRLVSAAEVVERQRHGDVQDLCFLKCSTL